MLPEHLQNFSNPIQVLDHGHVRLVDVMGDDQAIVDMARVSYQQGTKIVRKDRGLIRYLMRHWHTSPFEGVVFKLHVKMPIFVARQWFRHRTHAANEVSARYSQLPSEVYIPNLERIQKQSSTNKQGSDADASWEDPHVPASFRSDLENTVCEPAFELYERSLEEGVARELARVGLPLNTYTEFYWVQSLHNLLHLIKLRADSHAQWEIQEYARAIGRIVEAACPLTWEAFVDYRLDAQHLSAQEVEILREALKGSDLEALAKDKKLSKRERGELLKKLV